MSITPVKSCTDCEMGSETFAGKATLNSASPERLLMRSVLSCSLTVVLLSACSCFMPFDGPDVHHRDLPTVPESGIGAIADYFAVPETADHVYYFSDASLRCDYYLRFHIPDEQEYQEYKERMVSNCEPAEPREPGKSIRDRFSDWWDWQKRTGAESFALASGDPNLDLDFVIFDDAEQTVFCIMGED